ncbi:MAG: hypothetical protein V1824_03710 [archaeon]
MFGCLLKGFNIFTKKIILLHAIVLSILYFILSIFLNNYISDIYIKLSKDSTVLNPLNYFEYVFRSLGLKSIFLIIFLFIAIFLTSYIAYIISLSMNNYKTKKLISEIYSGIPKVLLYSLFIAIFYFLFGLILLFLLTYLINLNIFGVILLIFTIIVSIVIVFLFTLTNIFLGKDSNKLNVAFSEGWSFLKRRFWHTIAILIILILLLMLLYVGIDKLYYLIFLDDYLASIIIQAVYGILGMIYSTNVIVEFVKQQDN